jgi:hypothetical protein
MAEDEGAEATVAEGESLGDDFVSRMGIPEDGIGAGRASWQEG